MSPWPCKLQLVETVGIQIYMYTYKIVIYYKVLYTNIYINLFETQGIYICMHHTTIIREKKSDVPIKSR